MNRRLSKIVSWIVFYGLILVLPLCVESKAKEKIVFDNFSKPITLVKRKLAYFIEGTKQQVVLSNRIIIKARSFVSKQTIAKLNEKIEKVRELYSSAEYKYYSLSINDKSQLGSVLSSLIELQKNPELGLASIQPDILQVKTKSATSFASENYSPYLTMLDISSLWKKTKGNGIKIAIIDDGINLNHADLKHIKPLFSYDAQTKTQSFLPRTKVDSHGTKIAGIIFAAHNQSGIDGIAPEAELIAIRQPDTWTSNTLLSFQLAKLSGAAIINCSWHSQWLSQSVADIVDDLAQNGRNGKGIAVIFAAGNNGHEILTRSNEAAIESAIVVGANNQNYERLGFSNFGQSVDLFAYGSGVKTTLANGRYGSFAGTSLAAAIISGVSALLLSQHPEWDLQQLTQQLILMAKPISKSTKSVEAS